MAISRVQDCSAIVAGSGTPGSATVSFGSAVTAGNCLVAFVAQTSSGIRTYTVTDSVNTSGEGWLTAADYHDDTGNSVIFYRPNHQGGTVTVTITASTGTLVNFCAGAQEYSGGTTVTKDSSDILLLAAPGDNIHFCSTDGISSSNEVAVVCVGSQTQASTDLIAGTSPAFTEIQTPPVVQRSIFQWRIATAPSSDKGIFTNTGTARISRGAMAMLSFSGGAVTPVANPCILMGL